MSFTTRVSNLLTNGAGNRKSKTAGRYTRVTGTGTGTGGVCEGSDSSSHSDYMDEKLVNGTNGHAGYARGGAGGGYDEEGALAMSTNRRFSNGHSTLPNGNGGSSGSSGSSGKFD